MARGSRTYLTNDRTAIPQAVKRIYSTGPAAGDFTTTANFNVTVEAAGKVTDIFWALGVKGVDATDPYSLSVALKNLNAASPATILTTAPSINFVTATASAGTFISTVTAATGVVPGVVSPTLNTVAKGDILQFVATITKTTPDTNMADLTLCVVVTETQDFDPSA